MKICFISRLESVGGDRWACIAGTIKCQASHVKGCQGPPSTIVADVRDAAGDAAGLVEGQHQLAFTPDSLHGDISNLDHHHGTLGPLAESVRFSASLLDPIVVIVRTHNLNDLMDNNRPIQHLHQQRPPFTGVPQDHCQILEATSSPKRRDLGTHLRLLPDKRPMARSSPGRTGWPLPDLRKAISKDTPRAKV